MNIQISDQQQFLNEIELQNARNRVLFGLARFAWQLGRVTVHMTRDNRQNGGDYQCLIQVQLKNRGVVTVHQAGSTWASAVTAASAKIEPQVAKRLDWRSRLRMESAWSSFALLGQSLNLLTGGRKRSGYSR